MSPQWWPSTLDKTGVLKIKATVGGQGECLRVAGQSQEQQLMTWYSLENNHVTTRAEKIGCFLWWSLQMTTEVR